MLVLCMLLGKARPQSWIEMDGRSSRCSRVRIVNAGTTKGRVVAGGGGGGGGEGSGEGAGSACRPAIWNYCVLWACRREEE
jgi:hypothetical protein